MFKESNRIYWYLLGIIIFSIILLLIGKDWVIPIIRGQRKLFEVNPYQYDTAPLIQIDTSKDYFADFDTNYGKIQVDLLEKSAPVNVNNLVFLADKGYYNGTKFHRLIPDFLVQGGDRNTLGDNRSLDGKGGPGYFLNDEVNWDALDFSPAKRLQLSSAGYSSNPGLPSAHLERFTLAMASSHPNTNGSQFFFVIAAFDDPRLADLDGKFTVVGRVVGGGEVLNKIANVEVDDRSAANPRPKTDIVLQKVTAYTR
jgi:cyclophilin family peptidyl-prolyl cis-trans isomerase